MKSNFFIFRLLAFLFTATSLFATGEIYYSNGNVGIGTSTPLRKLVVVGNADFGDKTQPTQEFTFYGSNPGTNLIRAVDTASSIQITNLARVDNTFGQVKFMNANELVDSGIWGVHRSLSSRWGELVFMTHDGSSLYERIRIDKDGYVGVGTSTPRTKLEVTGTVSANRFVGDGSGLRNIVGTSQWGNGSGSAIYYTQGNIGIRTSTPNRAMVIRGDVEIGRPSSSNQALLLVGNNSGTTPYRAADFSATLSLQNTNKTNGNFSNLLFINSSGRTSAAVVGVNTDHDTPQGELVFITRNADTFNEALRIDKNGKVGIGTSQPAYKLDVSGDIRSRDLILDTAAWADDVFEPNYPLMDLSAVKLFVSQHKHLPGVPSESEIQKSGIEIKKMNVVYIRKIEELTLYILSLQDKILDLNSRLERIEKTEHRRP